MWNQNCGILLFLAISAKSAIAGLNEITPQAFMTYPQEQRLLITQAVIDGAFNAPWRGFKDDESRQLVQICIRQANGVTAQTVEKTVSQLFSKGVNQLLPAAYFIIDTTHQLCLSYGQETLKRQSK